MAIQHLLPQDISNYRFRLIGDMTIKQFASLAICIVLAIVAYSFPLPFFFKYPLIFAFIVLGVGMAFVPVQGRSLDIWMIAFIKSIYSPTQYTWKSTPATPETTETATPNTNSTETARQVSNPSFEITQGSSVSQTQASSPFANPKQNENISTTPENQNIIPETAPVKEDVISASIPENATPPQISSPIQTETPSTPLTPTVSTPAPVSQPEIARVETPITPQSTATSEAPAPSINLPIPFTPTSPNTLVGLTLTPTGHILDGVLVEIKKNNLTLRATKSNKLGQFMFARPLDPGLYQILAEKEGNHFEPYSLELTGDIVKPLKIQAQ